jgi:hypothetical protein
MYGNTKYLNSTSSKISNSLSYLQIFVGCLSDAEKINLSAVSFVQYSEINKGKFSGLFDSNSTTFSVWLNLSSKFS